MVTQLTGRARDWGTAEWDRQTVLCSSVSSFAAGLRRVFDHVTPGREAARGLLTMRQGTSRVTDYAIDFRRLAAESEWNAPSLSDAFHHGLSNSIKDELATRDPPADLDALISISIRIDSRLQERRRERAQAGGEQRARRRSASPPIPPGASRAGTAQGGTEPMQVGHARLSEEERRRRIQNRACMYCGASGHFASHCPLKGQAHRSARGRW